MTEAMPNPHRGDRLVLPEGATAQEVHTFAEGAGFKEGRENRTEFVLEKVWIVSGQLYFHYVDDAATGVAYVRFTGDKREHVERFTELARTFFSPIGVDNLMVAVREASTPEARAHAIVRLATGLPGEPPPEGLGMIEEAFVSSDAGVRRGALLSALYLDWPIVRSWVVHMERHDEQETLRLQARYFIDKNEAAS
ncbi:hypothetical protein OG828_38890 [Streptomyces sp. NBC_00457]|uniref:hypothetical protein n=1 Tax=Streptomyces sp. NBC_00457 TaxID=2975748 RepID=UPI002E1DF3C5